jgi:signal transduction histidine kinase
MKKTIIHRFFGSLREQLSVKKEAETLGISIWQTPSFLFIVMGFITLVAMTSTYFVSRIYDSPELLVLSECVVTVIVLSLGNIVIRGVKQFVLINKTKTEFVSIASHQLRSPVSAIKWQIELLLSHLTEGMNPKQLEIIKEVNRSNERMNRLVSDLLDVARIEQGRFALISEDFNMVEAIQEVIEELDINIKTNGVKVSFSSPEENIIVNGDKRRIKMVAENIISNAAKYSHEGGDVSVELLLTGRDVVVSVRDYGVGIPLEQQKKVFSKFFRSDNIVRYKTDGTGLGLYIAKNIMEQSGGKIWFTSKENSGSVFNFSLPLKNINL